MRMRWVGGFFLLMVLGLTGCRNKVIIVEGAPEDTTTHLGESTELPLANWLQLPRAELARLAAEWTETVHKQQESARANIESVQLLPQLHPLADSIVFADATFAPGAGVSLPPYLKEGQKDAAVALHLARFGDGEAARKLADPDDRDTLARIDACRTERNYPAEWTRLVGLVLQNAQLKLATGEPDGATELVQLHRQLRTLLDEKAAVGPLGAALLARGKQALTLAAAAWREPRWNKSALADDADAALAEWGTVPDAAPALALGAKQREVESLFGRPTAGSAVLAHAPGEVQRALDLLALPVSPEGAASVVAFLDDRHTLSELLVVYRPKINELAPEPQNLALALVEHGYSSQASAALPGSSRQTWTGGALSYEVNLLTRGSIGGALIRITPAGASAPSAVFARNPRDFGGVHLDRSFEQNRIELAPRQSGSVLNIDNKTALAQIRQPATAFTPSAVVLQREPSQDLLRQLTLRWSSEQNADALNRLVPPLWAAYGPSRFEGEETASGGQFVLTWENATTRVKLQLPFDEKSPELLVEDSRGDSALAARVETATQFDRRERQERLAAGKPLARLTRFVQLPDHGIDNLRLGMTRDEVRAVLPGSRSLRVQPLSDGWNVLFLNEPPVSATYWPRQLFVRFGADNRVAEVRVRYQEGPHAPTPSTPSLLDSLRASRGAPESLPAPWVGLWSDLPTRRQPLFYRWRDDVTLWTYQNDLGGSEVVLRDCPPEQPQGVELPPLLFCHRGVERCNLGDSVADVRKRWNVTRPLLASNGAEVLVLPANSPYDVLLVWYEDDKVARVIARHRRPEKLEADRVGAALQEAWSADLDHLGFLRRQDGPRGPVLQAYSWNDDRTRVRIFAQETEAGIRLFTEWRAWPLSAKTLAAR